MPLRQSSVRRVFYALAALYLCGTVFGGIGLGWIALHPPSPPITSQETSNARGYASAASQKFTETSVTTPDGFVLRAWFLTPQTENRDAVILLHGVSDNRMGMYGFGKWLLSRNYAVLLPDARSHGLSGGLATYGLKESGDIHLW